MKFTPRDPPILRPAIRPHKPGWLEAGLRTNVKSDEEEGGNLVYTAWVCAANIVTVQACKIDSLNPQKTAGSGSIRVDLWQH